MKFNFGRVVIGIVVSVYVLIIMVKIASFAFGPIIPDNQNQSPPTTKNDTTLIGNGFNAASSPVIVRSSSPSTTPPSRQTIINTSNTSGQSSDKEIFLSILAVFMVAGVIFYISRPKSKEWFLYEI